MSTRLGSLIRKAAFIGSVETLTVAITAVSGLLIVNLLSKDDYAFYTVIVACMTLASGITDMGLVHCAMPIVGRRAGEPYWVLGVSDRVFRRRWRLLAVGLLLIAPYWWHLARQNDWLTRDYVLASLVTIGMVLLTMRENYLSSILVILHRVSELTRPKIQAALIRIVAICAVLLVLPTPSVTLLQLANLAPLAFLVWIYSRHLQSDLQTSQPLAPAESQEVDRKITEIARPLYLSSIFYQFQGVVTIFLASLFGSTTVLAELGAAGRLAMMLLVIDRVAGILFFPAIARSPTGSQLTTAVVRGHLLYLGMLGIALISAIVFPHYWVMLLGSQYKDLEPYLWMVFLASLFMKGAEFCFRTMAARGHTAYQAGTIPAVLAVQAAYLALFGVADLKSVLGFSVASSFVHFFYQYSLLLARMYRGTYGYLPQPRGARLNDKG